MIDVQIIFWNFVCAPFGRIIRDWEIAVTITPMDMGLHARDWEIAVTITPMKIASALVALLFIFLIRSIPLSSYTEYLIFDRIYSSSQEPLIFRSTQKFKGHTEKVAHHFYLTNKNLFFGVRLFPFGVQRAFFNKTVYHTPKSLYLSPHQLLGQRSYRWWCLALKA